MSDNGKPPLAFPAAASIPIIGQVKHVEWFHVSTLQCSCDGKNALLLAGKIGAAVECPNCHRVYSLASLNSEPGTDKLEVGLKIGINPAHAGGQAVAAP